MNNALKYRIAIVAQLLLAMLAVQVINVVTDGSLRQYGILPREVNSLPFILSSPFLHGSWIHLINNAIGFSIFSMLCLVRGIGFYWKASLFIVIAGGLGVWLFGRTATHIGASGWVFGLWSLSIALAWFERSVLNLLISVLVILLWGGMVLGMLPTKTYVSFEAHIFGALAGVFAAAIFARKDRHFKWA